MKKDSELKKRKDGRYAKKVTLPNGKKPFVYGRTLKELNENRDDLLLQYNLGATDIDKTITVEKWGEKWWKIKKKGKTGDKSQYGYVSAMNNYIFEELGSMKLIDVKDIHIQSLINKMGEAGKSESLQKKVLITLNGMFKYAKKNGMIVSNPAEDIDIYNVPPNIREALNPIETELLLNALPGLRAEMAIHIALYCGLRRGEIAALKWTDINEEHKCFVIVNAVEFIRNRPNEKGTKTVAGNRVIPIPPHLWDMLQSSPRTAIFIVPSAKGTQMSESSARRILEPVQRRINKLPAEDKFIVTWHILRHTYATNLDKMGVSPKTCQYLLGHSELSTTKNIYTHFQDEHLEVAAKQLEKIYEISQKSTPWIVRSSQKVVKAENVQDDKMIIKGKSGTTDN